MTASPGHSVDADALQRPRRRHTDGSVTRAVAATPRTVLAQRRADKTAELRAAVEAEEADALAAQHGADVAMQLDLVPPDMEPARPAHAGLPPPETLWYSAARED